MDIIFIHGAPGTGKTSVARALHERLGSPWFEFGWIPEFRQKGEAEISYEEEERLSFENLCLVVRNYLRHGFERIIITDLRDPVLREGLRRFARRKVMLVTLYISDEETLKARVLDENRSSGYRDWEEALELNRRYQSRQPLRAELRIDAAGCTVDQIVNQILDHLNRS